MANKVLSDRLAVKKKTNGESPFSFAAPSKDRAHSGCLSAGDNYGVGVAQPLGKTAAKGLESGPIPQESKAFSPKDIFYGEDKRG